MPRLHSLHQVVSRVVDTINDVGVTLSIRGPLHNDLVEAVSRLEVATHRSA